jgi:hypothetical protein
MTTLTRPATINPRPMLVAAALALALLSSIVGGVVGAVVTSLVTPDPSTAEAPRVVVLDPKWVDYGAEWEARYRQMYPIQLDAKWVEYGNDWERRYRQMYPGS